MHKLEDYHVTLRDRSNGHRWTPQFSAESFAHAEEQAIDAVRETPDQYEIVAIDKDYEGELR